MKQDARSWSGTAQEKIRCQAVKAVLAGMTQVKAAETFGITRQAVGKWMVAQRRGGVKALRAREKGRPRTGGKIKESMGLKITQLITACFPDHLKLPFSMWTREAVCQLIRQRYGLKISISTMGRLLRRWGFTPQKPICHNLERSESEILLWKRQIFVTILKKAQKRRAYLVFIDEAGFMLEPLRRRTWAPRGCTPILKVPDIHGRISVIGAIAISPEHRHFSFHFHLLENNANFHGNSVVPFIEAVRRKIRSPFTLIWDQIRIH
ncbi:MAG: IS630 family transposase, partial [Kiritimatiellaeota bacterium]|nr:IS630 family transposase [Kiritimatiellota bacterium]